MFLLAKRLMDICLAAALLVVLSPLMILIGVLILIPSGWPVLFLQTRVGKNRGLFRIIKFRTLARHMPNSMPTGGMISPDYILFGRFLRKYSLDELPQLFNILMGDMSFVGPRPVLRNEYDLISEREKYGANSILPGLTGWAQVNGRDGLPAHIKARLDGYYASHMGLLFDIRIVFMTLWHVVTAKNVSV